MKSDSSRPLIPLPKLLLLKVSFLEEATLGICLHLCLCLDIFNTRIAPGSHKFVGRPPPWCLPMPRPIHSARSGNGARQGHRM